MSQESTYINGIEFKTTKVITKNDIVVMCELLHEKFPECSFKPEPTSEGGIQYIFKNNKAWYKTVRFCVHYDSSQGNWTWVNDNVMSEWKNNDDMIFPNNNKFSTYLKSFQGAPIFTIQELQIWEECFNEIGIVRVEDIQVKIN